MEVEELTGSETGLRTHSVFAHVLMKNAELYRAILEVFVRSREQFITHLRPLEVALSVANKRKSRMPCGTSRARQHWSVFAGSD
jgi:hypothetical protein